MNICKELSEIRKPEHNDMEMIDYEYIVRIKHIRCFPLATIEDLLLFLTKCFKPFLFHYYKENSYNEGL